MDNESQRNNGFSGYESENEAPNSANAPVNENIGASSAASGRANEPYHMNNRENTYSQNPVYYANGGYQQQNGQFSENVNGGYYGQNQTSQQFRNGGYYGDQYKNPGFTYGNYRGTDYGYQNNVSSETTQKKGASKGFVVTAVAIGMALCLLLGALAGAVA